MKYLSFAFLAILLLFISSCSSQKNREEETADMEEMRDEALEAAEDALANDEEIVEQKDGITISYFKGSEDFPNARLAYMAPVVTKPIKGGKVFFDFDVQNYALGMASGHTGSQHIANSHQGQHIHHILNNEPYTAHYTDTFTKILAPGHYVQLAFLSRSFHESIKNGTAYILNQFDVGDTKGKAADLSQQMMFYSRPKGEYLGEDTKNILLDFYLVNTDLSEDGNRVKATINGTEFWLNEWRPYTISGLPMGENTIKLELIGPDGNVVPGLYNTVERKITLIK